MTLHNVSILSKQADTAVCTALVRAGAELIHEADRITVRRRPLRAFEFDATQCPDLFPPLAALAAACEGESLITGTSRLAHKESDRAETLREEYAKVGIEIDLSTPTSCASAAVRSVRHGYSATGDHRHRHVDGRLGAAFVGYDHDRRGRSGGQELSAFLRRPGIAARKLIMTAISNFTPRRFFGPLHTPLVGAFAATPRLQIGSTPKPLP